MLYTILIIFIILLLISLIIVINNSNKIKYNKDILTNKLIDILTRYKRIQLNMDENEMLQIMNFRHDKSMTTEFTTYRYVYISRGGSGSVGGFISGGPTPGIGYTTYGSMSGSSKQHDESVVIIKCVNGKVTEVNPYNMSSIQIPTNYNDLVDLANLIGITI